VRAVEQSGRGAFEAVESGLVGFEIPDFFVVGYGLDLRSAIATCPFVGVLHPHVYKKASSRPFPRSRGGRRAGRRLTSGAGLGSCFPYARDGILYPISKTCRLRKTTKNWPTAARSTSLEALVVRSRKLGAMQKAR